MAALFANMSIGPIQATDPLTPDEEKMLDALIENDLEFWKEQKNGGSGEVVQAVERCD